MSGSGVLPPAVQAISLTILGGFLVLVISLIRAHRISVRDSLAWLLSTVAAIVATAFPQLLVAGAQLIGIQVPSNAVFGAGLVYVALNVLLLTIAISANAARTRRLAQECALLRAELDELRSRGAAPQRSNPPEP